MKLALIVAVLALAGCPEKPKTPAEKKAAAEATFTGELSACVAAHDTRVAIDACADDVRRRWAKPDGAATDGGAR